MSDPTNVVTAYDEDFDAQGKLVRSTPRQIRQAPADTDLRQMRATLRAIARNALPSGVQVPGWGQALAKALLWYTWYDEANDTQP